MLHGIFEMSRHTVREIMVPRTRVKTLEISTPIAEAANRFVKTGYTRLPVYRENLDTIIGVCHARDVLELVASGSKAELGTVIREILYVPEKMTLEDLLFEFQKKRTHMAVVIDEFSGVEGIATLEDVLEEIVGEIQDEHDLEGDTIRFLPGGEAMVRGIASLREVNNSLGLSIPTDVDVTLGGFVMTTLGHIPKSGESFIYENSRFTVERTSGHRVLLIRVTPIPLSPPSEEI
ncbi:MAG: hypothetical protein C0609_00545 [Deltaproteobacteria bacterium]|nr:MAG: hypothetical protein C0609_00545 [Deltaproteobacteria bacterium]